MSLYQKLPKILVPKLDNTIDRYLEVMRALFKTATYSEVVYYTRIFARTEGVYFQNTLMYHSERKVNWASDIWVNQCFFENRQSLLYTNKTRTLIHKRDFSTTDLMLTIISQYISGLIRFWEKIRAERIPQDYVGDMAQCMEQYKRIMGVHRKSLPKIDNWHSTNYSKYIIVMVEGCIFKMRVYNSEGSRPYSTNVIKQLLEQILTYTKLEQTIPIGTMTAMDRDNWFCVREDMLRSNINKESFHTIEHSLFGLCIDEIQLGGKEVFLTQTTVGDHRKDFTNFNRWYDLGLQCVFRKDGYFAWITEESIFDGSIIPQPTEVEEIESPTNSPPQMCQDTDVSLIKWELSNTTMMNVERGKNKLINWAANIDTCVFEFTNFGFECLQKYGLHPNGLVQQAIVLTYYKLYHRLDSMCQPVSLRRYREGRKEIPHIVTCENRNFVEALANKKMKFDEKYELFEKAIQKHHRLIADASHLNHYVRGLLALNWIIGHEHIYSDFFYIRFWNYFSKPKVEVVCSEKDEPILTTGIPLYEGGHYVYFQPKKDSISFTINTSFKNAEFKSSNRFSSMLEKSLLDIMYLIENRNS